SPRGAAELYVALTRATQRLGVLHHGPLPQALTGLTETPTPAHARQQQSSPPSAKAASSLARDRSTVLSQSA
ncbi:MAG TPA: hypothetical protein VFQ77_12515, partial [Pseudonocardiaceae bacterium]|nr:hypothetical protein [Pseudonocardiaceae bacterium]